MEKEYKRIDLWADTIETFAIKLQAYGARGELVEACYNEHVFQSDTVTVDWARAALNGMTREEFEESKNKAEQEKREKWEAKKSAKLAKQQEEKKICDMCDKGWSVLDHRKFGRLWDEIVENHKGDWNDLNDALEIADALNRGVDLETVNNELSKLNNPYVVADMVRQICDRGEECAANYKAVSHMDKEYTKINIQCEMLDDFVQKMQEYGDKGELVEASFNGHVFHSDTITLDSAYLDVTGYTKRDFEEIRMQLIEQQKEQDVKQLREDGKSVLDANSMRNWRSITAQLLNDELTRSDLQTMLDVASALNDGLENNEVMRMLDADNPRIDQMLDGIESICDRGFEFAETFREQVLGIENPDIEDYGPVYGE